MEYEQFFTIDQPNQHACYNEIKLTLVCVSFVIILIDCFNSCRLKRNIRTLKAENNTLKQVILKSIDHKFSRILKNGYETVSSDEE
jgi:hypothetical protein